MNVANERPAVRSAVARSVVVTALASLATMALLPWTTSTPRLALLVVLVIALAGALAARAAAAAHAALVVAVYLASLLVPRLGAMWPLPSIATVGVYLAIVRAVPLLRARAGFWTRGRLDRSTALLALLFVVLSAIALVVWRFASGADMTVYRSFVPAGVPRWLLFVAIVPYAMLNAVFEETVWRGALWEGCDDAFGHPAALVLTSASFGLAHYHGFPSGALGVALATVYGVMMGIVRRRTGGLFWPWAAHVVADVVIFTLVAAMVVGG